MHLLAFFLAVAWEQHGREIITVASVLGALAVIGRLVVVPAVRWGRRLYQAVEALQVPVVDTHKQVTEVNRAVNHVEPGESPLIQRVRDLDVRTRELEVHDAWHRDALGVLASHLGAQLPDYPKDTP